LQAQGREEIAGRSWIGASNVSLEGGHGAAIFKSARCRGFCVACWIAAGGVRGPFAYVVRTRGPVMSSRKVQATTHFLWPGTDQEFTTTTSGEATTEQGASGCQWLLLFGEHRGRTLLLALALPSTSYCVRKVRSTSSSRQVLAPVGNARPWTWLALPLPSRRQTRSGLG